MAKRKLAPIIKGNTLESTIEYTLITSILKRICEMTKKMLEYLRDNTMLDPMSPIDIDVRWFQFSRIA
jgi:hypothetical protein